MTVDAVVPMPETVHPSLEDRAAGIREWLDAGRRDPIMVPGAPIAADLVFVVRMCVGPAPFVGDPRLNPARYVWPIAVDDYGRAVAGDAELVWCHA